ncbi:hypothetical protein Pcinc_042963, partial [Petrolisthes cinctipes]
ISVCGERPGDNKAWTLAAVDTERRGATRKEDNGEEITKGGDNEGETAVVRL